MDQTLNLRNKTEPEKQVKEISVTKPETSEVSWNSVISYIPARKNSWYALAVLSIAAVAMIIWRHDFLLSIVLILAGVVIVLRSYAKPRVTSIKVNHSGLTIGPEKYFYHELKSFWLDYNPPLTKDISIEFKKSYRSVTRLPIEGANPLKIREIMVKYIPEKEHEVSFIDHIIRLLGF